MKDLECIPKIIKTNHMKKIIVFLILLSIIGCNNNQTYTSHVSNVDMDSIESLKRVDTSYTIIDVDNYKKMPYSELHKFLKNVKYIPLKSKEPIGVIDVIKIHKGRVFILDAFKSESIFIFDLVTGDLIKKIHDKGQGPAEYLGLIDMAILNDQIIINDRLFYSTLYYTLDGEFIKKVRSIPNFYIEALNGTIVNQLTFSQTSDFKINNTKCQLVFVSNDSIIRKAFPYYPIQENAVNGKTFWRNSKDELLFSPLLSDTVYQFMNDSSYFVKYVVKQKKSLWGRHSEYLNFNDHSRLVIQEGYTFLGYEFLEADDYVLYPISIKYNEFRRTDIHLYNKKTGLSFRTILEGEEEDGQPFTTVIKKAQNVYGNYFVGVFEEYEIDGMKKFIKQDKKNLFQVPELKSILTSDIKDLECILVLYEFNDIEDIDMSGLTD